MNSHRNRKASGRAPIIWSLSICFLLLISSASSYAAPGAPGTVRFAVIKLPAEALSMPAVMMAAQPVTSNPKMNSPWPRSRPPGRTRRRKRWIFRAI